VTEGSVEIVGWKAGGGGEAAVVEAGACAGAGTPEEVVGWYDGVKKLRAADAGPGFPATNNSVGAMGLVCGVGSWTAAEEFCS
jgi:hypothetical protein